MGGHGQTPRLLRPPPLSRSSSQSLQAPSSFLTALNLWALNPSPPPPPVPPPSFLSTQGPILEAEGTALGIVTAIAAPAALAVTFSGPGGHAGALLMAHRQDPSLAAAELALAVEAAALETGVEDSVATAGRWAVAPNAVNSVPREATLEIDIRCAALSWLVQGV